MTRSRSSALAVIAFALALALALFSFANGLAMLLAPARWYVAVPGVTQTGGYNAHFIRDIGLVYVLTGMGLAIGAFRPAQRRTLWALAAAWLGAHALFHLWEVAAGICGPDAIPRDFVGVTLPALIALFLVFFAVRNGRTVTNPVASSS